jgi:opacity protein-like surface antigen
VKKLLLASVAVLVWCDAGLAQAPDSRRPDTISPAYDWSGFYVGATAGAAWGQYTPRTSTVRGGYFGSLGAPAVTAAGMQTINSTGFIAGLEGGFNWQIGNLLLGLEVVWRRSISTEARAVARSAIRPIRPSTRSHPTEASTGCSPRGRASAG